MRHLYAAVRNGFSAAAAAIACSVNLDALRNIYRKDFALSNVAYMRFLRAAARNGRSAAVAAYARSGNLVR